MSFFALFDCFLGFESTLHTLWAKGGCSAQALNYVAVPQQQSCKNNQGARGQKVLETAKNGFFALFCQLLGLQSPVGPGHCAHLPPMGLWCAVQINWWVIYCDVL